MKVTIREGQAIRAVSMMVVYGGMTSPEEPPIGGLKSRGEHAPIHDQIYCVEIQHPIYNDKQFCALAALASRTRVEDKPLNFGYTNDKNSTISNIDQSYE